mmetsp:Transcript_5076/g.13569  ORF Transcript_5076/g.13569 Transcript_5076/m.13569 type:complete len:87 (-) Transcript_5076:6-266(-)
MKQQSKGRQQQHSWLSSPSIIIVVSAAPHHNSVPFSCCLLCPITRTSYESLKPIVSYSTPSVFTTCGNTSLSVACIITTTSDDNID